MDHRNGVVVPLPVAVLAENGALRGAENGCRRAVARVAELRPRVLREQLVRAMDFPVAREAELRRVRPAVQHRRRVVAVVAETPLRARRHGVVWCRFLKKTRDLSPKVDDIKRNSFNSVSRVGLVHVCMIMMKRKREYLSRTKPVSRFLLSKKYFLGSCDN